MTKLTTRDERFTALGAALARAVNAGEVHAVDAGRVITQPAIVGISRPALTLDEVATSPEHGLPDGGAAVAQRRTRVERQTVNLSEFPDLVVIYLGMRVRNVRGLGKLLQTGRQIQAGVAQGPDGLLLHENIVFSFLPPHLGMRQHWRDFDSGTLDT